MIPIQEKCLSFIFVISHLPEGTSPDQYVLCSKLWQQSCADISGVFCQKIVLLRHLIIASLRVNPLLPSSKKFYWSRQLELNQKSNLSKSKKQGNLA